MALEILNVPTLFTYIEDLAIEPITISAAGGAEPYTFSAIGLPAGLTIDYNTGIVSGITAVSGNFPVQFEVIDADGAIAIGNSEFSGLSNEDFIPSEFDPEIPAPLVVGNDFPRSTAAIRVPRQQFWVVGRPISAIGMYVPQESGFTSPLTFSAGWLPPGIAIDSATGILSGTPLVALTNSISLEVKDSNNVVYRNSFEVIIVPAANAADAGQEAAQSGMLLSIQNPACQGISSGLPATNIGQMVLDSQAAMATAYPDATV